MAGNGSSGRRGKLGRAPGAGRGVEGEVGGLLAKQMEGRRAGRGRKRAEEVAHGTARRVVAVARRAAVLRVRAGRWRRVERLRGFGRNQGRGSSKGAARGRRPQLAGTEQGREREEREREKEICLTQI